MSDATSELKQKRLTFAKNLKFSTSLKNNKNIGVCVLTRNVHVDKTQIADTMQNKDEIYKVWIKINTTSVN